MVTNIRKASIRYGKIAAVNVMKGLAEELNAYPLIHFGNAALPDAAQLYRYTIRCPERVISLEVQGLDPQTRDKVRGKARILSEFAEIGEDVQLVIRSHARGIVSIEIPKPKELWLPVTVEDLLARGTIKSGAIATIGVSLRGQPQLVDFTQPHVTHVVIAGETQSGKTVAQQVLAWNLAYDTSPDEILIVIFDVAKQGYTWHRFEQLAHLAHPIVTTIEEAEQVLAWACGEIKRRGQERRKTPKLFLFIDELAALVKDSKNITSYLSELAAVGGELGIHLIVATQFPQIKLLGSPEIKRNLTTRLCGRVDDALTAVNVLGVKGSGAEELLGYGDFLLRQLGGGPIRIAVAKASNVNIDALEKRPSGKVRMINFDDPSRGFITDGLVIPSTVVTVEAPEQPEQPEQPEAPMTQALVTPAPAVRRVTEPIVTHPKHAALGLSLLLDKRKGTTVYMFRRQALDKWPDETYSKERAQRDLAFSVNQLRTFILSIILSKGGVL